MIGEVPPRPDLPPARPDRAASRTRAAAGRRIPVPTAVSLAVAAMLLVTGLAFAAARDEAEGSDPPLASPSTSPSPGRPDDGPEERSFDVDVGQEPVPGFPRAWREIVALDGTFRAVVRPPVYVYELDDGGWEIEFGGYEAPHLYMYGRPAPPLSVPQGRAIARSQIQAWAGGSDPPVPVRTRGRDGVTGWEVTIARDGTVERYRVFAARGWVIGLSTRRGLRNDRAEALGRAFLRSFEPLGPDPGDDPVSV